MKIAYLDCFSGISGDMCLGALVDAGVSVKKLIRELKKLPVEGYEVRARKVKRAAIAATKVDVILRAKGKKLRPESEETYSEEQGAKSDPTHPPLSKGRSKDGLIINQLRAEVKEHRAKRWEDIERIIHKSSLSKRIKEKGLKVFRGLFEAEAKVHGERFDRIHLHELSAVDCLIDVFGTIIGFDILTIEKIYSSPLNLGSGFTKTGHGILPVPAPASAEILKGVPVYSTDSNFELTTPTGAALVKELSSAFGDLPLMDIEQIGFGAGSKNFEDRPNVLRLFVGQLQDASPSYSPPYLEGIKSGTVGGGTTGNPPIPPLEKLHPPSPLWQRGARGDLKEGLVNLSNEKATVIEANIDDMNPQMYEYVMERLFKKRALDVFLTQVLMKKGRPGIILTVLCEQKDSDELMRIILKETTTIGLRFYEVRRRVLQREIRLIDTEFGKVRVKFSSLGDEILKAIPEYEDCKRIARKLNIPLVEFMRRIRIPSA